MKIVTDESDLIETNDELFEHFALTVDKGQEALRIDKFLTARLMRVSRTKINEACVQGNVWVNDKVVSANYKIKPNDVVKILLPHPKIENEIVAENIPLNIVYEDDDVLVVNKPAGMVVHPASGNYTGTLVNALMFYLNNLPFAEGNEVRPGLVHRIDKNTSGLVVIAKNEFAMNFLTRQFAEHTIDRKYIALVWGDFDVEEGTIEGNVGRNLRFRKFMDVFPEGDQGKEAITHYKVLEHIGYVALVECKLETGRTHQIRVHMKHIGHPVFNDDTYGGDKIIKGTVYTKYKQFVENCFKLCPRQALHAKSLGFIHPVTKKHLFFECDIPEDMRLVIEKWRNYINTMKKV